MASTKSYMMARRATATTNYRFLTTDTAVKPSPVVEFDESDIWGGSTESQTPPRKPISIGITQSRKFSGGGGGGEVVARSLPVNVLDWSKILRDEHKEKWSAAEYGGFDGGCGDEDDEEWVPPHEYLDRTRDVLFSVHEGVGRTFKGRDLRRVRNAIWERTGFQD